MKSIVFSMGIITLILFGCTTAAGQIETAAACAISTFMSFGILYFWEEDVEDAE